MRTLADHIVEGDSVNHQLTIEVLDEPGAGNACHDYHIVQPHEGSPKPGEPLVHGTPLDKITYVHFQNGPIKEVGVNGITNEALLAIVIDRLRGFQSGPFSCRDNAVALTKIEEALMWLQRRTRERIKRGVEGTLKK